jgi:hypothetical protein
MGLGAFTEGLQGGIAARDKMDLNRQYKSLLKGKMHEMESGFAADEALRLNEYRNEYGTEEGFEARANPYTPPKDPALIRFGGWLKGKMGFGGGQEAAPSSSGIEPTKSDMGTEPLSSPVAEKPKTKLIELADGGAIPPLFDEQGNRRELTDEERMKRSYGEYYVTGGEAAANRDRRANRPDSYYHIGPRSAGPTAAGVDEYALSRDRSGGGVGAYLGDVARVAGETNTAQALRNVGAVSEASVRNVQDAGGARATGDAVRGTFQDAGAGALNIAGGVAADLGLDKLTEFGAGFLGFDGKGEEGVPAKPPADAPAGAGAATEATTPAPEKSDEQIAQQAISTGEEAAAENFDYRYLPEDTRPEDMPSMNTQDWSRYRYEMMDALLMKGKDPDEALKIVDDITVGQQMRGMERELRKAMNYLNMGDYRATMFAIRQGFQYFPNGVDVKFAVQTNPKTGEQALVSFGVDEETGEPLGAPQIITPDKLAAMGQNFSDPDKFRQWTKDGHDLQLEIAKFKDLSKYRQESLDIQEANAITARKRVDAAGASGGRDGMSYSDVDRRSEDIATILEDEEFREVIPEGLSQRLGAYGEEIMRYRNDLGPRQIAMILADAWNGTGKFDGMPGGAATVEALIEQLRKEATGK